MSTRRKKLLVGLLKATPRLIMAGLWLFDVIPAHQLTGLDRVVEALYRVWSRGRRCRG